MSGYKCVILPDVHLDDRGYSKAYGVAKKFIKDFKPDKIILLGDFMNCSALSHWDKSKRRKIEGKRYDDELKVADKEIKFLESYSKKVIWLEGNHEKWVQLYLDYNPELEGLLEIPIRLELKSRGIKWIPYNKIHKEGKLRMIHGAYANKYHANKHWKAYGCNLIYGHTHLPQEFCHNAAIPKPMSVEGLGCLCDFYPSYLKGKQGNWINQFGILYVAKNGEYNLYKPKIIRNRFYWGGKTYQ